MNKILLFLLVLPLLCSCAPVDLNYQFPTAIALEYKENEYVVSVSLPSLEENSNKSTDKDSVLVVVWSRGKTLSEALEKMNLKERGRISAAHIRTVILHKSLFEEGNVKYATISQYFMQTAEFRLNGMVYLTNENIGDVLSTENPLTTMAFNNISDPSKSQYYNKFKLPRLIDTMIDYYEDRYFYIPSIYINDEIISTKKEDELSNQGIYDINEFCFLPNDKLLCIAKEKLSGVGYIQEVSGNDIEYGKENEVVSGNIKKVKSSIKYDNKPKVKVKIYFSVINNLSNDTEKEIKEELENIIKNDILETYNNSLEMGIDIFNIEDGYRRKRKSILLSKNTISIDVNVVLIGSQFL